MPRAETVARSASRDRELSELETQRPELSAWLRPLRVSLASLDGGTWTNAIPVCSQHRAPDAPLLHDAIVTIEYDRVVAHVRAVLRAALSDRDFESAAGIDALTLLSHAVNRGDSCLDSPAIEAAADIAAIPLLVACARATSAAVTQWAHGYCHVCGELPVFAEVLGLERTRQLRCARCCTAWKTNVLICPFCGESDHARLGSLVPDGPQGQICWVETCSTCKGYIKTRAALRSMIAESVLIEDARTVDLDLVAIERGFTKPSDRSHRAVIRLMTGPLN